MKSKCQISVGFPRVKCIAHMAHYRPLKQKQELQIASVYPLLGAVSENLLDELWSFPHHESHHLSTLVFGKHFSQLIQYEHQ